MTLYERRDEWERREIAAELERCNGSVRQAAKNLGINRQNLYKLARRLGTPIRRPFHRGAWAVQGL
jgi:DNA-binding NtrC family response regulator